MSYAAATKIVPTAEANPSECLKTNVLGAVMLSRLAKHARSKKSSGAIN